MLPEGFSGLTLECSRLMTLQRMSMCALPDCVVIKIQENSDYLGKHKCKTQLGRGLHVNIGQTIIVWCAVKTVAITPGTCCHRCFLYFMGFPYWPNRRARWDLSFFFSRESLSCGISQCFLIHL